MAVYGTPQIYALAAKLTEDRIPGTSPGFGSAAAADGIRYPYIFPIAATYWSQGAAAVDFVKKQLGGSLKGKKIAYLFYDNPAGREPIEVLEDLGAARGLPAQDVRRAASGRGDGRPGARHRPALPRGLRDRPSVRRRARRVDQGAEAHRLSRCARSSAFVWASAEANIEARRRLRAWPRATTRCSSPAWAPDYPVLNEIREMYKKQGKPAPKEMASTVFYNRGVLVGGAPRRGHPERAQGQAGRQDHRRRREGRLREDLQLHPRRAGAAAEDHADRPRGRRARADLAGQGRQVREGRPSGSPPIRTWSPSTSRPRRRSSPTPAAE